MALRLVRRACVHRVTSVVATVSCTVPDGQVVPRAPWPLLGGLDVSRAPCRCLEWGSEVVRLTPDLARSQRDERDEVPLLSVGIAHGAGDLEVVARAHEMHEGPSRPAGAVDPIGRPCRQFGQRTVAYPPLACLGSSRGRLCGWYGPGCARQTADRRVRSRRGSAHPGHRSYHSSSRSHTIRRAGDYSSRRPRTVFGRHRCKSVPTESVPETASPVGPDRLTAEAGSKVRDRSRGQVRLPAGRCRYLWGH